MIPHDILRSIYKFLPDCRGAALVSTCWYAAYAESDDYKFWSGGRNPLYALPKMVPVVSGKIADFARGNPACVYECVRYIRGMVEKYNLAPDIALVPVYISVVTQLLRRGHSSFKWIAEDPILAYHEKVEIILCSLADAGTPELLSLHNPGAELILYIRIAIEGKNDAVIEYCWNVADTRGISEIEAALSFAAQEGSIYAAKTLRKLYGRNDRYCLPALISGAPEIIAELVPHGYRPPNQTLRSLIWGGCIRGLIAAGVFNSTAEIFNFDGIRWDVDPIHFSQFTDKELADATLFTLSDSNRGNLQAEILRRNKLTLIENTLPLVRSAPIFDKSFLRFSTETLEFVAASGVSMTAICSMVGLYVSRAGVEFCRKYGLAVELDELFSYNDEDALYILENFPSILRVTRTRLLFVLSERENLMELMSATHSDLASAISWGRLDVAAKIGAEMRKK